MTDTDPSDETDSEQTSGVTRRDILVGGLIAAGAIGVGGAAGQSSNDPDLGVGGGNMADAVQSFQAKIYEGTLTERPGAGKTGRFWKVDDPGTPEHGNVYKDDGSSWNLIDLGVGSFNADELRNIWDYIVSPSDDLADIVNNQSSAGETIYLQSGVHTISKTLFIKDDVTLRGAGIGKTTIKLADGSDTDCIRAETSDDLSEPTTKRPTVAHFSIDGNKQNQSGGYSTEDKQFAGVRFVNTDEAFVYRIRGYDCLSYAVEIKASFDARVSECTALRCGDDGISVSDRGYGSTSRRISVESSIGINNRGEEVGVAGSGIEVDDGPRGVTFTDCLAVGNVHGFDAHTSSGTDETRNVTFQNCIAVGNDVGVGIGYSGAAPVRDVAIIGGYFDNGNNGVPAARITTVDNLKISGATFKAQVSTASVMSLDGDRNKAQHNQPIENLIVDGCEINGNDTANSCIGGGGESNGVQQANISDSVITGSDREAVKLSGTECDSVKFNGNTFVGNDTGGYGKAHIHLIDGLDNTAILNNTFVVGDGNATTAVNVDEPNANVTDTIIRGNDVSDMSSYWGALGTDPWLWANYPHDANAVDSLPSHEQGKVVLASPNADPDSDSNAEWVMSDGTAWQEIVDLPNWT